MKISTVKLMLLIRKIKNNENNKNFNNNDIIPKYSINSQS